MLGEWEGARDEPAACLSRPPTPARARGGSAGKGSGGGRVAGARALSLSPSPLLRPLPRWLAGAGGWMGRERC